MARACRGSRSLLLGGIALALGCAEGSVVMDSEVTRDPVEARTLVDRAVATTGDLITYRVTVDAEPGYEVEIPEAGAEIAGFRIVDVGQEEAGEKGGRILRERWYQLRADLVGSYVLPPIEVRYREASGEAAASDPWQTLSTSEIFVEVASVLPADGQASDIRGLKPLREIETPTPWLTIVSIVVGLGLLAGGLFWYLRRRAANQDSLPPVPAHDLAFAALNRLRSTDFGDSEAVRLFYFEISEVVRAYVEGRFLLNATDLTTEEILRHEVGLEDLTEDQSRLLHRFLIDTDQVKFAHREPSRGDIEKTYERALGFVEGTRPVPEPAAEAQAA